MFWDNLNREREQLKALLDAKTVFATNLCDFDKDNIKGLRFLTVMTAWGNPDYDIHTLTLKFLREGYETNKLYTLDPYNNREDFEIPHPNNLENLFLEKLLTHRIILTQLSWSGWEMLIFRTQCIIMGCRENRSNSQILYNNLGDVYFEEAEGTHRFHPLFVGGSKMYPDNPNWGLEEMYPKGEFVP